MRLSYIHRYVRWMIDETHSILDLPVENPFLFVEMSWVVGFVPCVSIRHGTQVVHLLFSYIYLYEWDFNLSARRTLFSATRSFLDFLDTFFFRTCFVIVRNLGLLVSGSVGFPYGTAFASGNSFSSRNPCAVVHRSVVLLNLSLSSWITMSFHSVIMKIPIVGVPLD